MTVTPDCDVIDGRCRFTTMEVGVSDANAENGEALVPQVLIRIIHKCDESELARAYYGSSTALAIAGRIMSMAGQVA